MNSMLDKFYKFKRFLINLNLMSIPLGEYVFNLQHSRQVNSDNSSVFQSVNHQVLGQILSFLPYSSSFRFRSVSKNFTKGFNTANDLLLNEIYKEIFYLRLQLVDRIYNKLPIVFEHSIFSSFFLMLDDILSGENFFSKEQLADIKNVKIENILVKSIAKIIMVILDEKVAKKMLTNGSFKYMYVERLKTMVINGSLVKSIRNLNKLDIPLNKLNNLYQEVEQFLDLEKLAEVRKMNRGFSQLLNWIIMLYEFHRVFNPFDFISSEYFMNRFEKEDLELIKYFCEVMNYLRYNLKIKYKFSNRENSMFEFSRSFEDLKLFLASQGISMSLDADPEYSKLSQFYFETKEVGLLI